MDDVGDMYIISSVTLNDFSHAVDILIHLYLQINHE